jgi:O-antigen/teichoic acid export membrane protein
MSKFLKIISEEVKANIIAFSNKGGFIRNSFNLTLGTAISQGIPIILSPVLTRLFTPGEFGLYAIISSITVIISVISTGKYETVIVIARDKRDAVNLIGLSLFLSLCISLITLILLLLFPEVLINALNQPRLANWIFICPLISFFISIYICYNEWCIRKAQFVILAFNKVINSSSISFSNILFGITKLTAGGLILGEVLGRFITAIVCTYHVVKTDLIEFKTISISRMISMAKKFIDCPRFILPGQFLNTFGGQVIVLVIAAFYGDTNVGYYSMTVLVLNAPTGVISTAVRDVFKQRATIEYKLKKNCIVIFKRITLALSVIAFIIFCILFFILPDLFAFAFGEGWRTAGEYARILSPMVLISFVSESVSGVFFIAEKMKAVLYWQATYFIVNVASLVLGYYLFKDIKKALLCFMIGKSLVHLLGLYMSYVFAKGDTDRDYNIDNQYIS